LLRRQEYFENINPADRDDIIGLFPKSGNKDIDNAVMAAQQAFPLWSEMTPPKRGELIFKAAEAMKVNQEQLARVIVREMGKTMPESMAIFNQVSMWQILWLGKGEECTGRLLSHLFSGDGQ